VVAQIPLSFVLYDRVMGCPTYDGIEDNALIAEWSIGVVANSIAEEMAITCRIREIVLTIILVHP
jgi:hypothetical protein